MTGAEYIVSFLQRKKVTTVFGYPGATVLELYDALGKADEIRHILVRHEQGAVFAASGYAKASGKPGVCIATSGPGAVNLTTGIAEAYLDSVPLFVITGQVDTASIGRDAFQEADIMGITIPITKHNYLIKEIDALPRCLEEAWRIATQGRRGPVLIDIARNVLEGDIPALPMTDAVLPRSRTDDYLLSSQTEALQKAIGSSYRPLLLAGGGVAADDASLLLSRFAQESGIPVATTLMGMGIMLDRTAGDRLLLLGMTGRYGTQAAREALSQCDLLIAVGTRFSDRTIADFDAFSRSRTIIHCDIDPAEISKNVTADIGITCPAHTFLRALCEMQRGGAFSAHTDAWRAWTSQLRAVKQHSALSQDPTRLTCEEIISRIDAAQALTRDAVYVSDVGEFQMTAARILEPRLTRGFLTSGGLGAMGFGLPAAIGAAFARTEDARQIIALCGDGGFQMSMQELATLHQVPLPVKLFLFDNRAMQMIERMQDAHYSGRHTASSLADNPDFDVIATAYGLSCRRLTIRDRSHLQAEIAAILASEESMLIHCFC